MKAVILAAGRGSRMGGKTKEVPKCLTELCGKTLLERQIEAVRQAGIEEIGIVRGYMAEKISIEGIKYFENPKWSETNMLMSLCCAGEWLETDECVISYSDIVYTAAAIESIKNCKRDICITYNTKWLDLWQQRFADPLSDAETFRIDQNNNVIEIGNKARSMDEIEGQYMGLLKFSPAGWQATRNYLDTLDTASLNRMDMTRLLSNLIQRETSVYAIPYGGLWLEVDNETDLALYEGKYREILI